MQDDTLLENMKTKILYLEEELKKYLNKENLTKYGLLWEDGSDSLNENINFNLIEVKDKEIHRINDTSLNLLIEGDNYYSLKHLLTTHKGKIDVIYIDPPYNTGNKNFIYNDKFLNNEDSWKHSNWLSFMNKRLKLAKELLSNDGCILISIDENEFAELKLLCDQIFGVNNFINNFIVQKTTKNGNNQFKKISSLNRSFEYVFIYRKTNDFSYTNPYKETNERRKNGYWRGFQHDGKRDTMMYEIGNIKPKPPYRWIWGEERGLRAFENYLYYLKNFSNEMDIKNYWETFKDKYEKENNCPFEFVRVNKNSIQYWVLPANKTLMTTDMMEYFIHDPTGKRKYGFDTVKNLNTIKKLLDMVSKNNSIILDFFAGSGTTGHATLELNKDDDGQRTFILCNNNDNNICEEITYKRLSNVINGYMDINGKLIKGLYANLKYLKIEIL